MSRPRAGPTCGPAQVPAAPPEHRPALLPPAVPARGHGERLLPLPTLPLRAAAVPSAGGAELEARGNLGLPAKERALEPRHTPGCPRIRLGNLLQAGEGPQDGLDSASPELGSFPGLTLGS